MLLRLDVVIAALALIVPNAAFASYSNLISSTDGSAVFFQAKTGFNGTTSYKLHFEQGQPVLTAVNATTTSAVDDINADGSLFATTSYAERYCGFAGSSCFTAQPCQAGFVITGGRDPLASGSGRRSTVRLNRTGTKVWIEQTDRCVPLGVVAADYEGLYALPGLTVVQARDGKLANYQVGRRMITSRDQVLTFGGAAGNQLQLVDATGVHPIRHIYGAEEAVIDADGRNVVYLDAPGGHLHWIDLTAQSEDDLGHANVSVRASSLSISDDGKLLAFVTVGGTLQLYHRATGILDALSTGPVNEIVLAGNGQYIFAVTTSGRLVRVDLSSGSVQTWLEAFPDIQDASTLTMDRCPLICYPAPDRFLLADATSLVVLHGTGLDQAGFRVRIGDRDLPLFPLSSTSAYFQVPADFAATANQTLTVSSPTSPLKFSARLDGVNRVVTCFGALHQNFDAIVSSDNPARTGEAVHVFMTGLTGTQPVAAGVANPLDHLVTIASPPPFNTDGGFQSLFFGLAPGAVGLQQLDIRIQSPVANNPSLFGNDVQQFGCTVPPAQ